MSTTDYAAANADRERWGSRVGLILAMAGNAVGLGNFLRFPNQAVQNGQGTFMLAYFVGLLLLGIPLMWVEWSIGRRGGAHGYSTCPGMFQTLTRARFVKYLGAIGVVMPLLIVIYYVYIESWTLGYAVSSLSGDLAAASDTQTFFDDYLGANGEGFLGNPDWQGSSTAYWFFGATILVNLWVLSRGLSKGIEIIAKIGMPVLLLSAIALVARVLTLEPENGRTALDGLGIYWNPEWRALFSPAAAHELYRMTPAAIWLAAAGQIFFTLSVGSGAINTYASYLTNDDDIALTGLATVSMNEFCEVVLGGTLAIPAAYLFFGMSGVMDASSGNMGLAFVTMPQIFGQISDSGIAIFGTLWFGLLFVAGITSSLALSQPTMAFMQDTLGLSRRRAALVVGLIILVCVQPVILLPGVLDEIDYWAGTFGLVVFSTIEVLLFIVLFGPRNAWREVHKGADIRVWRVFKPIMTFVTPLFLVTMLGFWAWQQAVPTFTFENDPSGNPYNEATLAGAKIARALMAGLLLLFVVLVGVAARRGHYRRAEAAEPEA